MKIRTKLILLFSLITVAILSGFASLIYITSSTDRESEFYKNLRQQSVTKANLLLEAKVDPKTLQTIYLNTKDVLYEEEVAVYDTAFNLLYHDAVSIDIVKETQSMINEIVKEKEIRFTQNDRQIIGFLIAIHGKKYIITAAGYDKYGLAKLDYLRNTLFFSLSGSILIISMAGYFFSGSALMPVKEMVDRAKEITATNLDLRLNEGNSKDEIAVLAVTFNEMLDRLENSFDAQKQFVSNISHELRTPLATLVTELELSLKKDRNLNEYREVIHRALSDTQRLVKLSNSLLDLAKANYDPSEVGMKMVRLDELLMDARETVLKSNSAFKVNVAFDKEIENDDYISVNGNEYLLKVAFINLIENGCKFSGNHQCTVSIAYGEGNAKLQFIDTGIGIDEKELDRIFTSFFRGKNKNFTEGNGIGLSLTQKIITMHKGTIKVKSEVEEGSTFTLTIPHV